MTNILTFCDYFLPGYKGGGPITTLRNAGLRLSPGHKFRFVTRDRDLGDESPYAAMRTGVWTGMEETEVIYLAQKQQSIRWIVAFIRREQFDILYLNSFHSLRFTLLPLVARRLVKANCPAILAPRGELNPSALALKPFKKSLYRRALMASGLLSGVTFQASSDSEAQDIWSALGPHATIKVAPDFPSGAGADPLPRAAKQVGTVKLAFLGRISPMKNIDWFIRELAMRTEKVGLAIYGPIEDLAYWEICRKGMESAPNNVQISYGGPLLPSAVRGVLAEADALVLPSLGENYAQVVAEALGAGCPALVSDRTPWKRLPAEGAGWCLPLERPELWHDAIGSLAAMSEAAHASLRIRARKVAKALEHDAAALSANRELFDQALAQSRRFSSDEAQSPR